MSQLFYLISLYYEIMVVTEVVGVGVATVTGMAIMVVSVVMRWNNAGHY